MERESLRYILIILSPPLHKRVFAIWSRSNYTKYMNQKFKYYILESCWPPDPLVLY